ncbi:hypothetical protein F8R89_28985 [Streptomyces sp. SS1-1]|uniref:hypothetical protein n=1 Tax=Streptomyces sp. SS1-1 TaxID=2651869 RepID=UPI00124FE15C|nr:hypothetical protein [Streptomyces sp. SS1-1]KAB2975672.1 hypothetical protein F8R89_28985 [Streptomyces sp. SS1-1]
MRRTVRALSVAALAGAALGAGAQAAVADPTAEVGPASVTPGESVTVSVTCDPVEGVAPATLDAVSQAFEDGTVQLQKVGEAKGGGGGPVYRGAAQVSPAENFEDDPDADGPESGWTVDGTCPAAAGAAGAEWSAPLTVAGVAEADTLAAGSEGEGDAASTLVAPRETGKGGKGGGCTEPSWGGGSGQWGDGGGSQSRPRAEASGEWKGDKGDKGGKTRPPEPSPCETSALPVDPAVPGGVKAGQGGVFTDSVPALVCGGVLIAGAAGGAVYRLRRRTPAGPRP